jgi:putative ABC transport system ATP-binding protein
MSVASGSATPDGPESSGGVSVHLRGVVHLYRQRDRDVVALRGVDLDVDAGEMVALLGPSGMGKSTVMRLVAGLLRPSAGEVRVGGRDLARLSASARRSLRATEISHVVQGTSPNLLPFATARQNVWFAQQGVSRRRPPPHWDADVLLERLHLSHVAGRRVAELPRGEQQQVALAAGVGPAPRLLLADEPTSQLGEEATDDVVVLLRRINAELGTTVMVVTHDPRVAERFSRTVTIRDGRVAAEGRRGTEYAVIDGAGSLQLPPDVLELLPPSSMVRVVRVEHGVELRRVEESVEEPETPS